MPSAAMLSQECDGIKTELIKYSKTLEERSLNDDETKKVKELKSLLATKTEEKEQAEYLFNLAKQNAQPKDKEDRDFQTRSRAFSLSKVVANVAGKGCDIGSETEISDELKRTDSLAQGDFVMPFDALQTRTINTDASTAGANKLKSEDYLAGNFIEFLRNVLVVGQAGATMLRGASSAIRIPRQTNTTQARWLAEDGTATNDDLTFDSVELKPRKLMGLTSWSAQTALSSDPSIEMICRNDLMQVLAHEIDRTALYGGGDKDKVDSTNKANLPALTPLEPSGITRLTNALDDTTAGADLTYAKALGMASTADQANIGQGRRAFICNPKTRYKLMQTLLISTLTSADYLYAGAGIAGMPTIVSNVVKSDNKIKADNTGTATGSDLFYGNWSDLLIAYFGSGVSLLLNEYGSGYTSGAVQLRSLLFADVAVRHAASFSRYRKVTTA